MKVMDSTSKVYAYLVRVGTDSTLDMQTGSQMIVAKEVKIPCVEAIARSDEFEFPAIPQKKGMTIVLKLNQRILSPTSNGWNRYCGIEINGAAMRSVTERNYPRLLGRGQAMRTTHYKEQEVPYWSISSQDLLLAFFGPAENENIDKRILDREFGYNFYGRSKRKYEYS